MSNYYIGYGCALFGSLFSHAHRRARCFGALYALCYWRHFLWDLLAHRKTRRLTQAITMHFRTVLYVLSFLFPPLFDERHPLSPFFPALFLPFSALLPPFTPTSPLFSPTVYIFRPAAHTIRTSRKDFCIICQNQNQKSPRRSVRVKIRMSRRTADLSPCCLLLRAAPPKKPPYASIERLLPLFI